MNICLCPETKYLKNAKKMRNMKFETKLKTIPVSINSLLSTGIVRKFHHPHPIVINKMAYQYARLFPF